jgi:phytanoyl-CoA dioxygenase PhyH/tetratricopeptide repeat protein
MHTATLDAQPTTAPRRDRELALGLQHHQAGRFDAASEIYRGLYAADPRDSEVLFLMGVLSCDLGAFEPACRFLNEALAITPNFPEAKNQLAVATRMLGGQLRAPKPAEGLPPGSFANFFDTFGYLVVRNLYDKNKVADLVAAYDAVVTSHFGTTMEAFLASPQPVSNGVEMSRELLAFLQTSPILPIIDQLLGEGAVFFGSDLSTFRSGSQFHRDALGDYRLLKVGLYLQDSTAQEGGQFCCVPGTHHFGDRYSDLCSQGLQWPHGAGYAANVFNGEFDFNQHLLRNNTPAVRIDLAAGDAIFFNQALIHMVPAGSRPRRMIAMTFFEGEKSFNSRPRAQGEFAGLTHAETLAAIRLSSFLVERSLGRNPTMDYHANLRGSDAAALRKYLREFTAAEYEEINDKVLVNSFQAAYRFITKANPAKEFAGQA